RRNNRAVAGPDTSCQTLVTNDGITRIAAAATGGITVPSNPIATVGKPIPVTPLTIPATRNVNVNERKKIKDSCIAGRYTSQQSRPPRLWWAQPQSPRHDAALPVLLLEPRPRLGTMRYSTVCLRVYRRQYNKAHTMRLDLADLHLFLCIVDAGSITQGATRANLALASASERLRNIEADAGVALLQRHSRGVITTEAGEALAHHARLILRQQHLLKTELKDFSTGARGTLHLYANTAALTEFLPPRLAPWLAARPRLRIDLKERTSAE